MQEQRDPQQPNESEEDFLKREKAHWDKVEENEASLLRTRAAVKKRYGEDSRNIHT